MLATQSIPLSAQELSAAIRADQPYDILRLDRVLRVDDGQGLIEVQAGARWKTIAERLRPGHAHTAKLGRSMLTVGESLACNAAGPDGRPAVMHVESMTLVMPNGELQRVSRSAQSELFGLVAGGHGLFGALYSVTLRIGSLSRALNDATEAQILSPALPGAARRPLRLLLPPAQLAAFLARAEAHCRDWRLALPGVRLRRTCEENDTFLRWARRDYAALTLSLPEPPALGGAVRAAQLRHKLLEAAIACGGSFPLHCTPEATRSQVEACYPQLPRFLAEKRRVDPAERMVNGWYRHHRRLFSSTKCAARWGN
jgi:FAD/FMN-containing dehydrogenase